MNNDLLDKTLKNSNYLGSILPKNVYICNKFFQLFQKNKKEKKKSHLSNLFNHIEELLTGSKDMEA